MVEQTVNVDPDGSTTFEGAEDAGAEGGEAFEETMEEIAQGVDPAIYLLVGFIVVAVLYFLHNRKKNSESDDYFSSYEKVSHVKQSFAGKKLRLRQGGNPRDKTVLYQMVWN